jgi:hypothetical protein
MIALRVAVEDFDVPNAIELGEEAHISEICTRTGCLDEYKLCPSTQAVNQSWY